MGMGQFVRNSWVINVYDPDNRNLKPKKQKTTELKKLKPSVSETHGKTRQKC